MDKKQFEKTLKKLRETPKRKFNQTVDMIINLRDIDLKKTEQQVDAFIALPKPRGKIAKICALIGPEMMASAKGVVDEIVLHDDFASYATNKKKLKQLAVNNTFFIAQANIMPDVAKTFGRVLGPKGKMPNPKAGCVVPSNANIKALVERLRNTVRVTARTQMCIKLGVGKEDMSDEDLLTNIVAAYNGIVHALPREENNVRKVLLKLTMGAPLTVGEVEK